MAARLLLRQRFAVTRHSWVLRGKARLYTALQIPYSTQKVTVSVRHGYPVIAIPLPSRGETCDFVLRPYAQTVADFTSNIKREDGGIESASLFSVDGNRIAGSTQMGLVLQSSFDLRINNINNRIEPPPETSFPSNPVEECEQLRMNISQLYSLYNVAEHQLSKDQELYGQLEQLRAELTPLEHKYVDLVRDSSRRTEVIIWGGLSWMCAQFGFLSYLVWGEYDWDIMEPVTYFVASGTSLLLLAYYMVTRQDYAEQSSHERYFLGFLHRKARSEKFDIERYNQLKKAAADLKRRLDKLHDPLHLNLPTPTTTHHS